MDQRQMITEINSFFFLLGEKKKSTEFIYAIDLTKSLNYLQ